MREDLENILYKKFPKLFAQKDLSSRETCMCWGIETPDEWFDVIYKVCQTIQNHINNKNIAQIEFTQVKEKFGSLKIYYSNPPIKWVDGVIAMADAIVKKNDKAKI